MYSLIKLQKVYAVTLNSKKCLDCNESKIIRYSLYFFDTQQHGRCTPQINYIFFTNKIGLYATSLLILSQFNITKQHSICRKLTAVQIYVVIIQHYDNALPNNDIIKCMYIWSLRHQLALAVMVRIHYSVLPIRSNYNKLFYYSLSQCVFMFSFRIY